MTDRTTPTPVGSATSLLRRLGSLGLRLPITRTCAAPSGDFPGRLRPGIALPSYPGGIRRAWAERHRYRTTSPFRSVLEERQQATLSVTPTFRNVALRWFLTVLWLRYISSAIVGTRSPQCQARDDLPLPPGSGRRGRARAHGRRRPRARSTPPACTRPRSLGGAPQSSITRLPDGAELARQLCHHLDPFRLAHHPSIVRRARSVTRAFWGAAKTGWYRTLGLVVAQLGAGGGLGGGLVGRLGPARRAGRPCARR